MRASLGLALVIGISMAAIGLCAAPPRGESERKGFQSLFNGKDFTGWKVPKGDNGHWKVVDGVIDCDGKSESKEDRSLWTEKSFKNFVLRVDWRLKTDPGFKHAVPVILPSGLYKEGPDGKVETVEIEDVDSGIYLRGSDKSQVNIWMWPIGSGEVYGYREDKKMPANVRAAVTPKKKMDRPRGEWNTFEITMIGDRLSVILNGEQVIEEARLPNVPGAGPIALQHHEVGFDPQTNQWKGPPSLVQFRNISIKELPSTFGKPRAVGRRL